MANKQRGQVGVTVNGEKLNLLLSTNSICELEDQAGRQINDILDELSDPSRVRFKTVRLIFWALMLDARPDATLADAGRLIDGLRGQTDRILADAISAAFPDASGAADPDAPKI